jgi:hypothetical protein
MTLVISKGITLRKGYIGTDDPDAEAYIAAVEAADEAESPGVGALEIATKVAIHSFVKGCKNDGTWPAIKASCILAGARTLTGALVPLVGAAPTNVGPFVSGDYNRETGLKSDETKYLNSNRAGNADPQNNMHASLYATEYSAVTQYLMGNGAGLAGATNFGYFGGSTFFRNRTSGLGNIAGNVTGFIGHARNTSASFSARMGNATTSFSIASQTPNSLNVSVFTTDTVALASNVRLAFYSIGESLDLALLDARVTDLINAFAAAIP